jgi:hypothetical protein
MNNMEDKMNLPLIGEYLRGIGRLVSREAIQPPPQPPPTEDFIFEEITARCELRLNGHRLVELQELNDYYGLGMGKVQAIKDMETYIAEEHITANSDLEVVVIEVKQYFRARPKNWEDRINKGFHQFEPLDTGSKWNVPETIETIVWSSKCVPAKEEAK